MDVLPFMNPSLPASDATLLSGFRKLVGVDSEYNESHSSLCEFPDGEEAAVLRSVGYQKPKHMWMAKDQALANNVKTLTPTGQASLTDLGACCLPYDTCNLVAFSAGAPNTAVLIGNRGSSPTQSVCASGSPSTTNSIQGLSVGLSSSLTNTSSSLYSRTPPISGHELSTNGSASPCPSPNLHEVNSTKISLQSAIIDLPARQNSEVSSLPLKPETNAAVVKRSSTKTSRKRSAAKSNSFNSDTSSSLKPGPPLSRQSPARRKRQTKTAKSGPISKTKRGSSKKRLTLTLSLSSLARSDPRTLTDDGIVSYEQESPAPSARTKSDVLPSQPFGGLKIRLRRDSAPVEPPSGRGRRARTRKGSSGTFRIVESWCDADAPGGEYLRRAQAAVATSSSPSFTLTTGSVRVGDIVWAKLAGYPYWPSRVSAIWARTVHQLSQAVLLPLPQNQDGVASPSLAVLATPSDPNLAAGYTARVDWLAWDQCSYLSCAKLYPFKESYDKLYNPRTRVKGYAEAVRFAKRLVCESQSPADVTESELPELSPLNKSHSTLSSQASAPASTDSQWSAPVILPPSTDFAPQNEPTSQGPTDTGILPTVLNPCDTSNAATQSAPTMDPKMNSPAVDILPTDVIQPGNLPSAATDENQPVELSGVASLSSWAPLPQLDISGFGDFVSHVPTFSDDEEDMGESVARQLEIDLGSCV